MNLPTGSHRYVSEVSNPSSEGMEPESWLSCRSLGEKSTTHVSAADNEERKVGRGGFHNMVKAARKESSVGRVPSS